MVHLLSIPFNKLVVLPSWRETTLGTILQVSDTKGNRLIGMRCAERRSLPWEMVLVLHGERFGELLSGDQLVRPALDVTNLVEIRISECQAVAFEQRHSLETQVVAPGSGRFFLRNGKTGKSIFVCLFDPTGTVPVGEVMVGGISHEDLLVVGQTEVVMRYN